MSIHVKNRLDKKRDKLNMWRSLQQPRIRKGGSRTQSTLRFEIGDSKSSPKKPFLRLPFGSLSHIHSNNEVPSTTVHV